MAASGETSPDLPSDAASSSSSPASRPFDFDSGIKDMRNYLEKEAVGRQTAPAPEISTPTPSSEDEILDVSGSAATVQSTSGRHKHSRARRPSSVEDRDNSNEDGEASGNDARAEGEEEDTGELPHGQGKARGKGKGRPNENTHASAIKRKRRESPPPLARRKPPEGGRYILWSLAVLRKVCRHRGIKGQQRNNDKDAMAKLLERIDQKAGRPSPYTGDFGGDLSPAKGERSKTTSTGTAGSVSSVLL